MMIDSVPMGIVSTNKQISIHDVTFKIKLSTPVYPQFNRQQRDIAVLLFSCAVKFLQYM